MTDKPQKHVFISYVRENKREVDKLCNELTSRGVKVWLDRDDIQPGTRWKDAITDAIGQGDFFIACFSREYISRGKSYMNEELTLAIDELRQFPSTRVWFIPVLLTECDAPRRSIGGGETLLDFQWVKLYENWDDGVQRILKVINPIPPEVQHFLEALTSPDSKIRERAAGALGKSGNLPAIPALVSALNDQSPQVRWRAAEALGNIGHADPGAIKALIGILNDKNSEVRQAAVFALGMLRDPIALDPLINAMKDKDGEVRWRVAEALGKLGGTEAVRTLIRALGDHHREVHKMAAEAILEIDNSIVLPALRKALTYKNANVRRKVAEVLCKTGDQATENILIGALKNNKDPQVRALATNGLVRFSSPDITDALAEALQDEAIQVRLRVVKALVRIRKDPAVSHLIRALHDQSWEVRALAAEGLGKIGNSVAIPALAELQSDDNNKVSDATARALKRIIP